MFSGTEMATKLFRCTGLALFEETKVRVFSVARAGSAAYPNL